MPKVLIAGYTGAMGRYATDLVNNLPGFEITAGLAPHDADTKMPATAQIYHSLAEIEPGVAEIWLDFTVPSAVKANVTFALQHGFTPIVGTTGLTSADVAELQALAEENGQGGLIAPNFGMSAVLLMKFAKEAAAYFPDADVIEMHHGDKKDAPSGTALTTAQMIAAGRQSAPQPTVSEESVSGALGANVDGVAVHAVRLPGYIAHEQVLFGGPGEALTIRQDSFDRASFMSGVKVALQKANQLTSLVFGLEEIL
ncbi:MULTISPECIES: 4-hydroxy-tetrahydrodipicolinate reductase [Lactobacillaceae]|uniref:4-hydroxy-tetrahydrodipicolinate reductase n=1 Tax=Limosilactobacillus alvi TaxID=990412 RepID=A0ABS2ENT1_9LACO|nr:MULTISPECIES: 4-hydroxy-tetrahydrodipicolinate reductase [Lactobacillaceae]MBM6753756.1 4-hydroxy-tetrahydrodipicolinate reductase [Limosilactobacillus alvi]QLL70135.1 4-hydroxy-tetrahydrodipicolinate reductase [Lactobacillus sp. 3B(2020)]